jgi:hypothetical protein
VVDMKRIIRIKRAEEEEEERYSGSLTKKSMYKDTTWSTVGVKALL